MEYSEMIEDVKSETEGKTNAKRAKDVPVVPEVIVKPVKICSCAKREEWLLDEAKCGICGGVFNEV